MAETRARHAVIVGAGLAGLNTALLLAQRGFTVQVFDKLSEGEVGLRTKRTYIISVTSRGAQALRAAGVRLPSAGEELDGLKPAVRLEFWKTDGSVTAMPRTTDNIMCERHALVHHMVQEVKRLQPHTIALAFSHSLEAVDFDKQQAQFKSKGGELLTVHYDLLVAADGVYSRVRSCLQQHMPSFQVCMCNNGRAIKTFAGLPRPADLRLSDETGGFIRFVRIKTHGLGGALMWPAAGDTLSGAFSTTAQQMDALRSPADFEQFLRFNCPQLPVELLPEAARQLAAAPVNGGATLVKVSQLHGPAVVLLGDAAHAATPAVGLGAVAALESSLIFAQCLDQSHLHIQQALELFTEVRLPDVHALYELDRRAFDRMGINGRHKLAHWGFSFHMMKGMLLKRLLPSVFQGPAYAQMRLTSCPFAWVEAAIERDTVITAGIAGSLALAGCVASMALAQQLRLRSGQ